MCRKVRKCPFLQGTSEVNLHRRLIKQPQNRDDKN
jgi:hypothetical protein